MNKVILMGRLTKAPETRYTNSNEPMCICRYTLAVNRRFKRQGEADADFINCTAFGKSGEFADKYFKKGQMVSVVGRLQVRSYDDKDGNKRYTTDVVVEEQYFAESKASSERGGSPVPAESSPAPDPNAPEDGFYPVDEGGQDEDMTF